MDVTSSGEGYTSVDLDLDFFLPLKFKTKEVLLFIFVVRNSDERI